MRFHLLGAAAVLLTVSLTARANTIAPGGSGTPDQLTLSSTATLLDTVSGTISPGTFTAHFTESVYADPTNTFCAGCYDFVYNISDTGSTGIIERITGFAFGRFLTDVGYTPGSGVAPATVDRSTNGNVIGFNFLDTDAIRAGESTDTLIIETNATAYSPGLVSIQDGSAGTDPGLQPHLAATPEPAGLALMGTGLVSVAGLLRRRARA